MREATNEHLAARAAIADVINLYCHAIDRRRWDLLARCFHDDATYRFASIDGDWRHFVGAAQAVVGPMPITHHQTGNILYRIDGDRAETETYFQSWHRITADAPADAPFPGNGTERDLVIAGRYVDLFTRRDGDWRIQRRIGIADWRHDRPAADFGFFQQRADWRGATDGSDPGCVVID